MSTRFAPTHQHRVNRSNRFNALLVLMAGLPVLVILGWAAADQAAPVHWRIAVAAFVTTWVALWALWLARRAPQGSLTYRDGNWQWRTASGATGSPNQAQPDCAQAVEVTLALDVQRAMLLAVRRHADSGLAPTSGHADPSTPGSNCPSWIWVFAADAPLTDWLALRRCVIASGGAFASGPLTRPLA